MADDGEVDDFAENWTDDADAGAGADFGGGAYDGADEDVDAYVTSVIEEGDEEAAVDEEAVVADEEVDQTHDQDEEPAGAEEEGDAVEFSPEAEPADDEQPAVDHEAEAKRAALEAARRKALSGRFGGGGAFGSPARDKPAAAAPAAPTTTSAFGASTFGTTPASTFGGFGSSSAFGSAFGGGGSTSSAFGSGSAWSTSFGGASSTSGSLTSAFFGATPAAAATAATTPPPAARPETAFSHRPSERPTTAFGHRAADTDIASPTLAATKPDKSDKEAKGKKDRKERHKKEKEAKLAATAAAAAATGTSNNVATLANGGMDSSKDSLASRSRRFSNMMPPPPNPAASPEQSRSPFLGGRDSKSPIPPPTAGGARSTASLMAQAMGGASDAVDGEEELFTAENFRAIVGQCLTMCPVEEQQARQESRDLSYFEIIPGTGSREHGDVPLVDPQRAVKKYKRAAAAQTLHAKDVRPPHVLQKTMEYLVREIMDRTDSPDPPPTPAFLVKYRFVSDRMRALRQDFHCQQQKDPVAIKCYEYMVRFHILTMFELGDVNNLEKFDPQPNMEKLSQTLTSLRHMFHDNYTNHLHVPFPTPNEAEMHSYRLLSELDRRFGTMYEELDKFDPAVKASPIIQFCVAVYNAFRENNYARFFSLVRRAPYLHGVLLQGYFSKLRARALAVMLAAYKTYPLEEFVTLLGFESAEHATSFLAHYGIEHNMDAPIIRWDREAFFTPTTLFPFRNSYTIVGAKRPKLISEAVRAELGRGEGLGLEIDTKVPSAYTSSTSSLVRSRAISRPLPPATTPVRSTVSAQVATPTRSTPPRANNAAAAPVSTFGAPAPASAASVNTSAFSNISGFSVSSTFGVSASAEVVTNSKPTMFTRSHASIFPTDTPTEPKVATSAPAATSLNPKAAPFVPAAAAAPAAPAVTTPPVRPVSAFGQSSFTTAAPPAAPTSFFGQSTNPPSTTVPLSTTWPTPAPAPTFNSMPTLLPAAPKTETPKPLAIPSIFSAAASTNDVTPSPQPAVQNISGFQLALPSNQPAAASTTWSAPVAVSQPTPTAKPATTFNNSTTTTTTSAVFPVTTATAASAAQPMAIAPLQPMTIQPTPVAHPHPPMQRSQAQVPAPVVAPPKPARPPSPTPAQVNDMFLTALKHYKQTLVHSHLITWVRAARARRAAVQELERQADLFLATKWFLRWHARYAEVHAHRQRFRAAQASLHAPPEVLAMPPPLAHQPAAPSPSRASHFLSPGQALASGTGLTSPFTKLAMMGVALDFAANEEDDEQGGEYADDDGEYYENEVDADGEEDQDDGQGYGEEAEKDTQSATAFFHSPASFRSPVAPVAASFTSPNKSSLKRAREEHAPSFTTPQPMPSTTNGHMFDDDLMYDSEDERKAGDASASAPPSARAKLSHTPSRLAARAVFSPNRTAATSDLLSTLRAELDQTKKLDDLLASLEQQMRPAEPALYRF